MKRPSRKKIFIVFSILSILIFYFFTWGLVIDVGHEFIDVSSESQGCNEPDQEGGKRNFSPKHFWIRYNSKKIPTLIICNYIRWQFLPCDISLYKSDPTYLETHKNYKKFIIEKFEITYSDGTKKIILNKESPIEERTFEICSDYKGNIVTFKKVITKKLDLSINLSGVAIKENEEATCFHLKKDYNYTKYFRIYPFLKIVTSI